MSNLLDTILKANGGAVVSQLAREFGLGDAKARDALGQLAAAMGALASQNAAGGSQGLPPRASGSGAGDLLSQFLDADRDGSIVDDVLGLAKKFF